MVILVWRSRQLAKQSVASANDFVNLVKLMFGNARSFNAPYTIIHAAAVRKPPWAVLTAERSRLTRICLCALPCLFLTPASAGGLLLDGVDRPTT